MSEMEGRKITVGLKQGGSLWFLDYKESCQRYPKLWNQEDNISSRRETLAAICKEILRLRSLEKRDHSWFYLTVLELARRQSVC